MITVSPAREHDLEDVAALEAQAFPSPWKRAFFEGELHAQNRYCLVARDGEGLLVGYVFAMYYLDEMHINKIATDQSVRRSGVAMQLMEACRTFALQRGIRTFSLEVRESNEPAQAFYRKLNFHAVYTRRNYYPDGEAAVVMMAAIA